MTQSIDPKLIAKAILTPAWSGLVRADASLAELGTWSPSVIREPRILVPIDLQALYVPEGSTERFVSLPYALTTPDGQPPEAMPVPFDEGEPRAPGVYLHWALPDSLLNGVLESKDEGAPNQLALPTLPDRWVVLRTSLARRRAKPMLRGWVVEADKARVVPLDQWPNQVDRFATTGKTLAPEAFNGTAGGSLHWTGVADAAHNRFALHDTLSDITEGQTPAPLDNMVSYLVAGWWSDGEVDPLDKARSSGSLEDRLNELGWRLANDHEGGYRLNEDNAVVRAKRESLGLNSGQRYAVEAGPTNQSEHVAQIASKITGKQYQPAKSQFADEVGALLQVVPRHLYSTLLHGEVHGVPVRGRVPFDQKPRTTATGVAIGMSGNDVAAALAAEGVGGSATDRRDLERVLAAFTGQRLDDIGTADGSIDIEEFEHAAGFESLPGGDGGTERVRVGGESGPLPAGRAIRGQTARARSAASRKQKDEIASKLVFSTEGRSQLTQGNTRDKRADVEAWVKRKEGVATEARARVVQRPAPRYHRPLEPIVGVRDAKRSLRHRRDGRFSADGKLLVRWPTQLSSRLEGLVDAAGLIERLPNGAIPVEVLGLLRGALINNPYSVAWLAEQATAQTGLSTELASRRLVAEFALRYGKQAAYGAALRLDDDASGGRQYGSQLVTDQLKRFSLIGGVDSDPVGVTAWSQPWVPMFLEWEVVLRATDQLAGAALTEVELEPEKPNWLPDGAGRAFTGRSPFTTGSAKTLAAAIDAWLVAETARDANNTGEADADVEKALSEIANELDDLDVLSASLDSLHEQLLGWPVGDYGVVSERDVAAGDEAAFKKPIPIAVPELLLNGALQLARARIVDAFGRTLDLPVNRVQIPQRLKVTGAARQVRLFSRLLRPARWLFRLVDPADLTETSREADIDQIDTASMVNPVAGFLLPDHIDEALEFFDTAGTPIGQLMHEPFGGGVVWEIAPGTTGPADAGPLYGLADTQQCLGHLAAGLMAVDAQTRQGLALPVEAESALSALLRAVDTTLWTVDTFAGLGTSHVAGLVGRPIAVVRAVLRLDIDDDLDELDLTNAALRAAREAAYGNLADRAFPVRIGELTRCDDGLLGFFVNDDYKRFRVVDKAVRDGALEGGRGHGHLSQKGSIPLVPKVQPIDHPYLMGEDELCVRPQQIVRLTLLMHPAGKVHLTSGVLPRKSLQLARDWTHDGLSVIAPSARIGPVLIEPGEVRLPKISAFPKDQIWTRRDTPTTWRDDPIVAATQTALLPDLPSEVQEGYIRIGAVRPTDDTGGGT